jgi:chlorite dismutase
MSESQSAAQMDRGRPVGQTAETTTQGLPVENSWHCGHYFYRFDRSVLKTLEPHEIVTGKRAFAEALDKSAIDAPSQMQCYIISGHKADFGIMVLDEDPLKVDRLHQKLLATPLGPGLIPSYSFVSVTEVSEYLPSTDQYAKRLVEEGMDATGEQYQARVNAYRQREPIMRRERLTPDLPDWPAMCFYPMNKKRQVGENWFTLDFEQRQKMMSEHAKSGMAFAGQVTQLITVAMGFDDWEWGVTLWAKRAQSLKDIVYRMRFDEASARYAEFGAFYVGYIAPPQEILQHCQIV